MTTSDFAASRSHGVHGKAMGRPPQLVAPGERRVIELACEGLTDKEICIRLGVSMSTVRTHWVRVRAKMGVVNRAQVVAQIMEMKRSHEASLLNGREQVLHDALASYGIGIMEWTLDGSVMVDEAVRRLLGIESELESVPSSDAYGAVLEGDRQRLMSWVNAGLDGVPGRAITLCANPATGYRRHFTLTCQHAHTGDETRLICVVAESKDDAPLAYPL